MVHKNSLAQSHTKGMKRKIAQKDETSKKTKEDGGHSLAWDMDLLCKLCSIVIERLDFETQMKIAQLNRRLADVVELNAQHQLKKFQRHIREDKYM